MPYPRIVHPLYQPLSGYDLALVNWQADAAILAHPDVHRDYPTEYAALKCQRWAYLSFSGVQIDIPDDEQTLRGEMRRQAFEKGWAGWGDGRIYFDHATEHIVNPECVAEWALAHADYLAPRMAHYDGLFIDNFWSGVSWLTGTPNDDNDWQRMRGEFVTRLKRAFPGKALIVNGPARSQRSRLTSRMIEGVPDASGWFKALLGEQVGEGRWAEDIDVIACAKRGSEREAIAMSMLFDGWMATSPRYAATIPTLIPETTSRKWQPAGERVASIVRAGTTLRFTREFATELGLHGWAALTLDTATWQASDVVLPWEC